jgi:hypothetical protein
VISELDSTGSQTGLRRSSPKYANFKTTEAKMGRHWPVKAIYRQLRPLEGST